MTSLRDRVLTRPGLLRIPEETRPPAVLARAAALSRGLTETGLAQSSPDLSPLDRLSRDPALFRAHRAMLPPPRHPWFDPPDVPLLTGRLKLTEAPSLALGWAAMSTEEQSACLADAEALDLIVTRWQATGDTGPTLRLPVAAGS